MTYRLILAAAAAAILTACAPAAKEDVAIPPPPPALPTQDDVRAAYAGLEAAVKNRDPAALTAVFAPTAIFIGADNNELYKFDAAAMSAGAAEWFKSEPTVTPNMVEVQILDADTFVESGIITYDFKRDGKPIWRAERYTHVWQKQADGGWKIVTEHMSAMPKPLKGRLPALSPAAAPAPGTPPIGSATPTPTQVEPQQK
jgi:uncharacterized protein (TIGR02246 family)